MFSALLLTITIINGVWHYIIIDSGSNAEVWPYSGRLYCDIASLLCVICKTFWQLISPALRQ